MGAMTTQELASSLFMSRPSAMSVGVILEYKQQSSLMALEESMRNSMVIRLQGPKKQCVPSAQAAISLAGPWQAHGVDKLVRCYHGL